MRGLFAATFLLLHAFTAFAGGTVFRAYDVVVDPGGRPLSAYQVEISYDRDACSLVGIEGGEKPFARAPYYDPRGLTAGRVVIADFTTAPGAPRGRVRVARVHVEEHGDGEPALRVRKVVAGTTGGARIAARIELIPYEEGVRR